MKDRLLYVLVFVIAGFFLYKAGPKSGIFYGDGLGYYSYLPATFIYGNLTHIQDISEDTTLEKGIRNSFASMAGPYATNEEGNVIVQYTYGIAAMNAPFFLLSHLGAYVSDEAPNGFTMPYRLGIKLAAIFYALFGLFLLHRVLLYYFDKRTAILTTSAIAVGTNFLWFAVIQAGMAHINAFFLFALIVYSTHKIFTSYHKKWIVVCAFALGLLTIIRPTDLIAAFIPLVFGMTSVKNRMEELNDKWKDIFTLGLISFIIPILPQLIYWKVMTGSFFFYSYDEQGFDWLNPHILEGVFGPNNGWITYTPLMLIPLFSMFSRKWSGPTFFANLIILPVYIYVAYSWWCYNYINGFGSRPMIHLYPLLAFPLAGLLYYTKGIWKTVLLALVLMGVVVNLNYTKKAMDGTLFTDVSSHAFNFSTFFKKNIDAKDLVVRDVGIAQPTLEESFVLKSANITDTLLIGKEFEYSPFTIKHKLTENDFEYSHLEAKTNVMFPKLEFSIYDFHMMVVSVNRKGKSIFWKGIGLNNKVGKVKGSKNIVIRHCHVNKWGEVSFAVPLSAFEVGDEVSTFLWNPNRKDMLVTAFDLSVGE